MADIYLTEKDDTYDHTKGKEWTTIRGLGGNDVVFIHGNGKVLGGPGNDVITNDVFDYVMDLPDGRDLLIQYVDTGITISEEQVEKIKAVKNDILQKLHFKKEDIKEKMKIYRINKKAEKAEKAIQDSKVSLDV